MVRWPGLALLCCLIRVKVLDAEVVRDWEEIACETSDDLDASYGLLRNGLGDDSFNLWPDKRIPYLIGEGFNSSQRDNIVDAINDYNHIFKVNTFQWKLASVDPLLMG